MRILVLVIALFSIVNLSANNNEDKLKSFSISGKVLDNKESLTGVKVMLDNKEVIVYTDFEGNFTLQNVIEGEHTLSFSLIAYDDKQITFNTKEASTLEVELKEK
ncbi:MAG: carboxypeptidase-like regulatory domain-containing protein [Vicingus serpentipes]|nr:carboxypeptidase-like regulatory domain-containing protein [Vicingus serpentipes]